MSATASRPSAGRKPMPVSRLSRRSPRARRAWRSCQACASPRGRALGAAWRAPLAARTPLDALALRRSLPAASLRAIKQRMFEKALSRPANRGGLRKKSLIFSALCKIGSGRDLRPAQGLAAIAQRLGDVRCARPSPSPSRSASVRATRSVRWKPRADELQRLGRPGAAASSPASSGMAICSSSAPEHSALVRTPLAPSAAKRARCTLARGSDAGAHLGAALGRRAAARGRRRRPPAPRSADRCGRAAGRRCAPGSRSAQRWPAPAGLAGRAARRTCTGSWRRPAGCATGRRCGGWRARSPSRPPPAAGAARRARWAGTPAARRGTARPGAPATPRRAAACEPPPTSAAMLAE